MTSSKWQLAKGLTLFERRKATLVLASLLTLYAASFVLLYPVAITVSDEGSYLRQAALIARGSRSIDSIDPFTGEATLFKPKDHYPLGTALLMVPFVYVGGWQAGFLVPLISVVLAVVFTARCLARAGYSPLWAALILGYPPALVMGRVAMSDTPSLVVVAAGLMFFFAGIQRGSSAFLFAGLLAGFSVSIREGNALLFVPLFLGAVLRRDARAWMLVLGGLLGLSIRGLAHWLYFDDPFVLMEHYPFSAKNMLYAAPLYLLALLAFVPGGLVAGLAYRGERRPEIVATVLLFTGFHFLYGYSAEESGLAKRLILGPRYFIPMLPLLALCAGEVWPRLARKLADRVGDARRRTLERLAGGLVLLVLVGGATTGIALQGVHAAWARDQARIRDAIYTHTNDGSAIITNWQMTGKYFDLVYGDRRVLRRERLAPEHIGALIEHNADVYFVFLDRTDSAFGRSDAIESAMFRQQLAVPVTLIFDLAVTPTDRLHIWRLRPPIPR